MSYFLLRDNGMEMVNILSKKVKARIIQTKRFFICNIIFPIGLPILIEFVLMEFFKEKNVLDLIRLLPHVTDGMIKLVNQYSWMTNIFIFAVIYYVFRITFPKIFQKKELLPENYYFLVPSWMIRIAATIGYYHEGSAASIPIWQYVDYLYNKNSFGWSHLKLKSPEVSSADKLMKIKESYFKPDVEEINPVIRSIVVADTYPIDIDNLPEDVVAHEYVLIQSLKNGKSTRVRGYNEKLVNSVVEQVRKAESDGIKVIYMLLNANPKHTEEIVREAFSDAGRNSIQHLCIYESQSRAPFLFTTKHSIF